MDRYLGSFVLMILYIFKPQRNKPKNIKKVLFIQWWGMGESLLTLPAIKRFKEKNPNAKIHIMTTPGVKDIFDQPFIDKICVCGMSDKSFLGTIIAMLSFMFKNLFRYDIVIDMEEYFYISTFISTFVGKYSIGFSHKGRGLIYDEVHDFKTQHMIRNFCDLVGTEYPDKLISIKSNEYVDLPPKPIGLFYGTAKSCKERNWPESKWLTLYETLELKGFNPFFIIGPQEQPINDNILQLETSNISELAGVLKRCLWFVSNDTGPMHLASAMGTKTIGLFGPNIPELWAPYGQHSIYFLVECSPCIHNIEGDMGGCVSNLCMQNIEIEDILKIIENDALPNKST